MSAWRCGRIPSRSRRRSPSPTTSSTGPTTPTPSTATGWPSWGSTASWPGSGAGSSERPARCTTSGVVLTWRRPASPAVLHHPTPAGCRTAPIGCRCSPTAMRSAAAATGRAATAKASSTPTRIRNRQASPTGRWNRRTPPTTARWVSSSCPTRPCAPPTIPTPRCSSSCRAPTRRRPISPAGTAPRSRCDAGPSAHGVGEGQVLHAADEMALGPFRLTRELHVDDLTAEPIEHGAQLAAGELRAKTEVRADPEAEQLVGIGTPHVEDHGVAEHLGVAIGRRVAEQDPAALRDVHPADRRRLGGVAHEVAHRARPPDDLVGRVDDGVPVTGQAEELGRIASELLHTSRK